MKKSTNPFHKRNTPAPPEEIPQPASAMTDEEIEEGIRKTRREILGLQHEELRLREKARLVPGDAPEGSVGTKPRNFGEIFGKNNRRFK
jgi:hypothetical protein